MREPLCYCWKCGDVLDVYCGVEDRICAPCREIVEQAHAANSLSRLIFGEQNRPISSTTGVSWSKAVCDYVGYCADQDAE